MFRTSFLFIVLVVIAALSAHESAYAQTAMLDGTVVLQKDGMDEPVPGALVEVYRTDIKGYYKTQTNKRGEFRFAGILYGDYVISVSAPNAAPTVFPNVRAGQEGLRIVMQPGDGRRFTEVEVKQGVSGKSGGTDTGPTEEQKAAQAEIEKKNAEITAKNEKTKAGDATAFRANQEGNAALKAENYELALAKFSEGVAAVPDFVGGTPILLNGKMLALKGKGFKLYKEGANSADADVKKAKYGEANKAYDDALAAFQEALGIIKSAEPTSDPAEQKHRDTMKRDLYAAATEIHRLKAAGGVDTTKAADASTVITEYVAIEPDPEKKLAAQVALADIFEKTGDFTNAVASYRKVLETKPEHPDAMVNLGLSLYMEAVAATPEDKDKEQEALNYLQRYTEVAPITEKDPPSVVAFKKNVKDTVDYLKAQKLTPQKLPAKKRQ